MKLNNFIFNKAIPVTLVFCLSLISMAQAQATLQVATKKIERTIGGPTVRTLYINAEKADIEMVTWGKDDISVVMELSAKHPDRATAAQDLAKMQYIADRNGKDYFLRNYIVLKDGENKPVSNLKARYIIHLPASCAVDLKNTFGNIMLKGLMKSLTLKADFCTTTLSDLSGKGILNTTFGELSGTELAGTFTFSTDRTNIRLDHISGSVKLDALYGNVEIYPTTGLTSLAIRSKKSEVTLFAKNWQQFDYTINSAYATMKLPNGFKWKRNTADFKEAFFSKNQLANVDINAEFGQVTIK
ncbi:DUF4097 family beta strand repeat-containing protein [Dyadobacter sp. CY343]|uniref:DUF4097 family beta strand repeat-containing protein n=1 Tax=Dyadobacter sp. CY343 TaxID=2907299 RepID=UPI001F36E97C|nr:DUF4097 family beta strand repeat-containing protein [Dyadobacter sp. CY343]MCE7062773.1 DUF4097 family beta strand repeat-containing protein [Dyadobacter sp. CY343]